MNTHDVLIMPMYETNFVIEMTPYFYYIHICSQVGLNEKLTLLDETAAQHDPRIRAERLKIFGQLFDTVIERDEVMHNIPNNSEYDPQPRLFRNAESNPSPNAALPLPKT